VTTGIIYLGAVAPEALIIDALTGDSGIDMSTITDGEFMIRKPDGSEVTLAGTISNQSAAGLRLTHLWLAGEVDQLGHWCIIGAFTLPSGTVRTFPQRRNVLDPLQC
jgi:hypothetical protein